MKAKYLGTLAAISVLSLGVTVGCTNPCSAKTTNTSSSTVAQADPCASKTDPCAAKSNPCAAKSNPCASKANPCAAKAQTVGGPLSQELQGKPVVIDVFATWCPGCKNIEPTLSQLKQEYADKAHFVVLDVTDKAKLKETEASAEKLGLSQFLETTKSKTSTVAIVDPATGKILAMFKNNPNKADYTKVLDAALAGA
ncbi:MAG: thioredoxin family protein [Acaryochloris sp. CRU_2_0]|nr:thioredoxin family protein [Acaryochloris sp. CRU_2_0]